MQFVTITTADGQTIELQVVGSSDGRVGETKLDGAQVHIEDSPFKLFDRLYKDGVVKLTPEEIDTIESGRLTDQIVTKEELLFLFEALSHKGSFKRAVDLLRQYEPSLKNNDARAEFIINALFDFFHLRAEQDQQEVLVRRKVGDIPMEKPIEQGNEEAEVDEFDGIEF